MDASTVRAERRRRGIPPFHRQRPPIEWTEEMEALLGEAADGTVAAELGLPPRSVTYRRQVLGIPPYRPRRRRAPSFWTPARIAQLGKRPDAALARRWWAGSASASASARPAPRKVVRSPALRPILERDPATAMRRLGIGHDTLILLRREFGLPVRSPPQWTRRVLAKLGRVPDEQVAAELGIAPSTVRRKRYEVRIRLPHADWWTPEEDALVRTLPKAEAAARTGRSLLAVAKRRRHLGVTRAWRYRWSKSALARLGREPDAVIAADLGVPIARVKQKRRQLGRLFAPPSRAWTAAEDRSPGGVRSRRHKLGLRRRWRGSTSPASTAPPANSSRPAARRSPGRFPPRGCARAPAGRAAGG